MTHKHKKLYEVIPNKAGVESVDMGHTAYQFGKRGKFFVSDPGEAKAIQQSVGQDGRRDVLVIDVPNNSERGIKVFSMPRNWKDKIDWSK